MWFLIVALVYGGQILQEGQSPITFTSEEACVGYIHSLADKHMIEPKLVVNDDNSSYWVIPEKNGYEVFADCVTRPTT